MKVRRCAVRLLAALALVCCAVASASAASASAQAFVTPIQKVLQMLTGMLNTAQDEKHQEQVQWAAYKQFCDDATVEKQRSIKKMDIQIESLKASVFVHDTEAERLTGQIREHEAAVASKTNESQVALGVREVEREDYVNMHRNYSESITAIDGAIRTLKLQDKTTPGSALLMQARWPEHFPKEAERIVAAFLSQGVEEPDLTFVAAPLPNAYEFQSGSVLNLLEDLKAKFKEELRTLETEETKRKHAFEMLAQDLRDSVASEQRDRASKLTYQAKHRQASAAESSQLQDATASRAADDKDLKDLTRTCSQKADAFTSRQKMRADEISALQKAIDVIGGGKVAGAANTYLPSMVQRGRRTPSMFAQLRASVQNPNQLRAAAFLHDMSERMGSRVLSAIAVQARDDPFTKVKKLLQELIERLMSEATAEAEHKGWCDSELATNEQTRTSKGREVETLRAEIDNLGASIAQLGRELATLSTEIAEITANMAKATDLRDKEKMTNAATIQDAKDAQSSVDQAIQVLQDFYAKAAQATSFVQSGAARSDQPAAFDAPFQGQQGESKGVIAMLQVILSDFARLEQSTEAAEAASDSEYRQLMEDSKVAKVQKETDVKHKDEDKKSKEMTLVEKQTDLENAERQLNSAKAYFEKLRPTCINQGQSYEERVQRRRDEIEALQEALRILSGQDIASLEQQ